MPVISGGSGGGTAFNGGTITTELSVATTSTTANDILRVIAPAGYEAGSTDGALVRATAEDGTDVVFFDTYGDFTVKAPTGQGPAALRVQDVTDSARVVQLSSSAGVLVASNAGTYTLTNEGGVTQFSASSAGLVTCKGVHGNPVTSGALPTVSPSSGVAFQCSTTRDVFLVAPCTLNPTAGAAGTVKVELSPDNSTFSTLVTITEPAGVALDGTIIPASFQVPAGWYVKLTATNATIGTGTYY